MPRAPPPAPRSNRSSDRSRSPVGTKSWARRPRAACVSSGGAPSGVIARWSSMVRPERASPTLLGGDGEDIMPLTHALARCGRSKSAVPREI